MSLLKMHELRHNFARVFLILYNTVSVQRSLEINNKVTCDMAFHSEELGLKVKF
jgi:hypothetical protein